MRLQNLVACVGFATALTQSSHSFAGQAPASAKELIQQFEFDIKAKDTNALTSLVNWQGVTAKNKNLIISEITDVFNHEIKSVSLAPLSNNCPITNEINGIRYRPNIPPVGMIDVQYLKKENACDSMQIPYGSDKEGFWIPGTIEEMFTGPSMTELAARAKAEKAKASFKEHPELLTQKDESGQTPLIVAAWHGEKEMVETLLSFNVNIYEKDNGGNMAIHWAAVSGRAEVIKVLLDKKCDVNVRNSAGWTPLHSAAFASDQTNAVVVLLANHADVNAKADDGTTPLHWAALYGHKDVAALLIASKADISIKNNAGKTPLASALETNSLPLYLKKTAIPEKMAIAELLQKSGAIN